MDVLSDPYDRVKVIVGLYFTSWIGTVVFPPLSPLLGIMFFALLIAGYYIAKDKQQQGPSSGNPKQRHWVLISGASLVSLGFYPLYYVYSNRQSDKTIIGSVGQIFSSARSDTVRSKEERLDGTPESSSPDEGTSVGRDSQAGTKSESNQSDDFSKIAEYIHLDNGETTSSDNLTNAYFRRVKWLVAIYFLSLVLFLAAVPPESEGTSGFLLAILALLFFSFVISLPITGYFISSDKRMIVEKRGVAVKKNWPARVLFKNQRLNQLLRNPIITVMLTVFTFGFYPLCYLYSRWEVNSKSESAERSYQEAIDSIETKVQDATQTAESGNYEAALNTTAEAASMTQEAEQLGEKALVGLEDLIKLRDRIWSSAVSWKSKQIRTQFEEAKRLAERDEYKQAINTAEDVLAKLNGKIKETSIDVDEFSRQREAVQTALINWKVSAVEAQLDEIDQIAQNGGYEEAIADSNELFDELSSIKEQAERFSLEDNTSVDEIQTLVYKKQSEWYSDRVQSLLEAGEGAIRAENYAEGIELADRAIDEVGAAIDRLSEATVEITELRELERDANKRYYQWVEAKIKSGLEDAEISAKDGQYDAAIERTTEIIERVTSELEQANRNGITTNSLEELRSTARNKRFNWRKAKARSLLNDGKQVVDKESYSQGIRQATKAIQELDTAIEKATEANVDDNISSLEELRETVTQRRSEWKQDRLVHKINTAMEAGPAEYQNASDELRRILSELPDCHFLSNDERSVIRREAREGYVTVRTRGAENLFSSGLSQLQADEYDTAKETFESVDTVVSETKEVMQNWDAVSTDKLDELQRKARSGYADAYTNSIEKRISEGIETFENDHYEEAEKAFHEASAEAEAAGDNIKPEINQDRISHLQEIAETNVEITQRASLGIGVKQPSLQKPAQPDGQDLTEYVETSRSDSSTADEFAGHKQPSGIPTAPDIRVTYEDVEREASIGKGGTADVSRVAVTVDKTDHVLALKEPRFQGTVEKQTVTNFKREAETWAQLDDHEHIVGVVDWDANPLPWIAMEYMDAGHIGDRAGDLSLEQTLWTMIVTTEAVRYAHGRGVAHLDLKPENILFRSVDDAWDVPKIGDWGLSKQLLDHSSSVEGMSPYYAAPEQFDTTEYGSVDNVTDIYQLGAVFYELIVGHPPFEGQTFEVINKIQTETPVPPSELSGWPTYIDEILLKSLATEKTSRYEHVIYLRDELRSLSEKL